MSTLCDDNLWEGFLFKGGGGSMYSSFEKHCTVILRPTGGDKHRPCSLGVYINSAFLTVDKTEKVIHQLFWSHDTPFIGGCFFYSSTFFKSCYSVNSFFLYFLLGSSLTSWLIFFFFNVHAVKFSLCSAQFYGIWQMYRFMYLPPQYHIEHFTALKITWCGPFIENLCPSPSLGNHWPAFYPHRCASSKIF